MNEIADAVNQYGVPTVVAVGMAYFIYYIWKFVTKNILPALGQASSTLVQLIDRVRMLDNDMIRLDQKINTIIEIQDQQMIHLKMHSKNGGRSSSSGKR